MSARLVDLSIKLKTIIALGLLGTLGVCITIFS